MEQYNYSVYHSRTNGIVIELYLWLKWRLYYALHDMLCIAPLLFTMMFIAPRLALLFVDPVQVMSQGMHVRAVVCTGGQLEPFSWGKIYS